MFFLLNYGEDSKWVNDADEAMKVVMEFCGTTSAMR